MSWPIGTSTPSFLPTQMMETLAETQLSERMESTLLEEQPHERLLSGQQSDFVGHKETFSAYSPIRSWTESERLILSPFCTEEEATSQDPRVMELAGPSQIAPESSSSANSGSWRRYINFPSPSQVDQSVTAVAEPREQAGPSQIAIESFPNLPREMMETQVETQPHERQDISQHIGQQDADISGKSSHVKRRKLKSDVWQNFVKHGDKARCIKCDKEFNGSSKLGTTHLRNHFKSCQRKTNGGVGGDEPANLAGSSSNPIAIKKRPVMDQQFDHLDAARMIIRQEDFSLINSTNVGYIIDVYKEEKEKLRNYFEKLSCRFSLTVYDMGSPFDNRLCLMVWFINDDWELRAEIIGFKYLTFDGETIIKDIKNMLLEWGIENNLSSMVVDGEDFFLEDDKMISCHEKEEWFSNQGSLLFNNKLLYFESVFLAIVPMARSDVFKRLTRLFDNNFQNAINVAMKYLRPLTGQVIPTPEEWWLKFRDGEESDRLGVLKNVLDLKNGSFELEIQNVTEKEWDMLRVFYEFLKDTNDFEQLYRNIKCNANAYFPLFCKTYKWSRKLGKYDFAVFQLGLDVAEYHWCEYNLVLATAAVLDPRYKLNIVEGWYMEIFGNEWRTEFETFNGYFNKVYTKYAWDINKFKPCTSGLEDISSSISYKMLDHLGRPCESSHVQLPHTELHHYLEGAKFPLLKDFDIFGWWRFHAQYFPTLARMARDFLSIQISCLPLSFLDDGDLNYDDMDSEEALEVDIREVYGCTKIWLAREKLL